MEILKLVDLEEKFMAVRIAHGYADLGMWDEVRTTLAGLPENVSDHPLLHPLKLRMATAEKDFSGGAEFVWRHILINADDWEIAGMYMLGFSRFSLDRKDYGSAAGALAVARSWVPSLQEVLEDNPVATLTLSDEAMNNALRVTGVAKCRYLSALATSAADAGDHERAEKLVTKALMLLESLPEERK